MVAGWVRGGRRPRSSVPQLGPAARSAAPAPQRQPRTVDAAAGAAARPARLDVRVLPRAVVALRIGGVGLLDRGEQLVLQVREA